MLERIKKQLMDHLGFQIGTLCSLRYHEKVVCRSSWHVPRASKIQDGEVVDVLRSPDHMVHIIWTIWGRWSVGQCSKIIENSYPSKEFNYSAGKWTKSKGNGLQKIVGEDEWANDSIWPGYWRSMADFPISYDYMILKLIHYGNLKRGSDPCPNLPKENIMFVFHPYSTRTCRLRFGSPYRTIFQIF